ncbi:MAG TPA: hypothetical protein ENG63_04650 [Candidatus Desulfofervidus auxilii]|uniref:Uncharacterized protein n=1 Tax=Desulfofervidus auxilii TaxID=1621989 RepID=A0A7C0U2E9_DESA2|nr:hypothetical protein [Candidatus Desulfofervidus auxilii]
MEFVLRKQKIKLTKKDLINIFKEKQIKAGRGKKYFVIINSKKIPVKDALYHVLRKKQYDFSLLDFTTADAIRIFKKLGLKVIHEQEMKGERLLKYAGILSIGGNALEDEKKLYT